MAEYRAKKAPKVYWPAAPMLKRPVLKAKATDRPVMIRGAAWMISIRTPMPKVLAVLKKPPWRMALKPFSQVVFSSSPKVMALPPCAAVMAPRISNAI